MPSGKVADLRGAVGFGAASGAAATSSSVAGAFERACFFSAAAAAFSTVPVLRLVRLRSDIAYAPAPT
jgi:hypothetical protein